MKASKVFDEMLVVLKQNLESAKITVSPEEHDCKFLEQKYGEITDLLYKIRYVCEEHSKSRVANEIEQISIRIQSSLLGWDCECESDETF